MVVEIVEHCLGTRRSTLVKARYAQTHLEPQPSLGDRYFYEWHSCPESEHYDLGDIDSSVEARHVRPTTESWRVVAYNFIDYEIKEFISINRS